MSSIKQSVQNHKEWKRGGGIINISPNTHINTHTHTHRHTFSLPSSFPYSSCCRRGKSNHVRRAIDCQWAYVRFGIFTSDKTSSVSHFHCGNISPHAVHLYTNVFPSLLRAHPGSHTHTHTHTHTHAHTGLNLIESHLVKPSFLAALFLRSTVN